MSLSLKRKKIFQKETRHSLCILKGLSNKLKHSHFIGTLISIDFYFAVFSLVLVSIEKIYQTLTTIFDFISKLLEARKKNTPPRSRS